MKRLLIDFSMVLKRALYAAQNTDSAKTIEFNGKDVKIPDRYEGYEIFLISLKKTLKALDMTPQQCVLVKDGANGKAKRREFIENYCVRPAGPKEWIDEFYAAQELAEKTMLSYGALSVSAPGVEADDIIYYLSEATDSIVWSGDVDLLQCKGQVWDNGSFFTMDKFMGIEKRFVKVYRSLVGEQGHNLPGAKGFGESAFRDMLLKYGDSCLEDLLGMLEEEALEELQEHVADFKPFQKIIDNKETVYACFKCASPIHPGWNLEYKAAYPKGDGTMPEWDLKMELVTRGKLTPRFLEQLTREIDESQGVGLDLEAYTTPEGKAWSAANKAKNKSTGPLDQYGQVITGFSLNVGKNNHKAYYFPIEHKDTDNISYADAVTILNLLNPLLPVVIHNISFELTVLRKHFELKFDRGYLPQSSVCTKILAGYVDESDELRKLKLLSKRWLDYDQTTYEEVMAGREDMKDLTGQEVLEYGCDDTVTSMALYRLFRLFCEYEDSWRCYVETDQPVHHIYAESYLTGVRFDMDKIKELQAENDKKFEELNSKILDFLKNYSWTELVEKPRRTLTLQDIAAGFKPEQEEWLEVVKKYPGCEFIPATELTPAEVKRLHLIRTGTELKATVRKFDKLAALIEDEEFSRAVLMEDLAEINRLAEERFVPNPELNLRSPKQLTALLYDVFGFPVRLRNPLTDIQKSKGQRQGNPAGNEDAFAMAVIYDCKDDLTRAEFLETIIAAKSCLTEESLYFRPYQNMPNPIDGYVHPNGGQSGAKSGRATSSGPNFAQVSGQKESRVREIYIPLEDDHVWLSLDFTAQELCIAAVQSKCPDMLSCYSGEVWDDIHSRTGVFIARKRGNDLSYEEFRKYLDDKESELYDEVNKCRKLAKSVNFLDAYMGTAFTLAIDLRIPEEEAQEFLNAKGEAFPGMRKWQAEQTEVHRKQGYAVTPYGRRRHIKHTWDEHELRGALNHIIQGAACEMLKKVLARIWREMVLEVFPAYFLFSVYDEVCFSVRKDMVLPFIKTVHPIMTQQFVDFPIKFRSSIEIGKNYKELTEIGTEIDEEKILEVLEKI